MARYLCKRSRYGYGIITTWVQSLTCVLLQFEFVRAKDQNGLYEICHVIPVDIERVEKEADRIIEKNEACNGRINIQLDLDFCSEYLHHPECLKYSEDILGPQPCIEDQANQANERKRRLKRLYLLKECARSPPKADELGTLEGMAQDSCIYNSKYVSTTVLVILV